MERIRAERQRQIKVEGWTPKHDDAHRAGELAAAAECYEWIGDELATKKVASGAPLPKWPWGVEWWKPADTWERNCEKAGALYLAEAERFTRAKMFTHALAMEIKAEKVAAKLDKPQGTAKSTQRRQGSEKGKQ